MGCSVFAFLSTSATNDVPVKEFCQTWHIKSNWELVIMQTKLDPMMNSNPEKFYNYLHLITILQQVGCHTIKNWRFISWNPLCGSSRDARWDFSKDVWGISELGMRLLPHNLRSRHVSCLAHRLAASKLLAVTMHRKNAANLNNILPPKMPSSAMISQSHLFG